MPPSENESFVGPLGEQLYEDLEDIEYDLKKMFPPIFAHNIRTVSESFSCPTIYVAAGLLASFGSCMGDAVVRKSRNHTEPLVLWLLNLGMKGAGKV